ncbi:glycoside hydrolase family 88 protein [Conexibacter sp. CPCC 206217]|uniref:glycoside hydrolase family 88 protein n=1 Tax=Conexibacter sp. CPCC 206217 TaxID=3064574 RepID=UPI002726AA35|nr:glycoside hydrolase family 88 protein [Conexibacter sp. CPCC 206217]MDO8208916.1 glycoside hydrolase family 88 protein [Conexibacter sp. CPCC 206217]
MTLEQAWQRVRALVEREERRNGQHPGRYPHYCDDGQWVRFPLDQRSGWVDDVFYDHGNWTAGFGAGSGWLRRLDGEPADGGLPLRPLLRDLEQRQHDGTTHDLGFLFYPSFVTGAITGELRDDELAPALTAALTLAGRYRESGGFIQAFGAADDPRSAGTSTIDTMMNLPLLWWAGRVVQGPEGSELIDRAHRHALTSAQAFLREDGSTYHLNRFDPVDGRLLEQGTFQGSSQRSCWSRGQAWAIAGFAWAYAATGDERLLDAAERAWAYFAARVPADCVVPWDFDDGAPDAPEDASASAIVALGLLILSDRHPATAARDRLRAAGTSLLSGLADAALTSGPEDGILQRSSYSIPHRLGLSGATPWGDYYYALALALATRRLSVEQLLQGTRAGTNREAVTKP